MHLRAMILRQMLDRLQPVARARRMKLFKDRLDVRPGQRVLDLGGTTEIWGLIETPLDITIVNLPGTPVDRTAHGAHRFTFIEGDATAMPAFADRSFDIIFSNSVIEHVGDASKRADFAREARRLAASYIVQTPSIHFPLEPHTGLPFWWYYPRWAKEAIFRRWERVLPEYGEMVQGTTVVSRRELQGLFPDAQIDVERVAGFVKSYTAWRRG